MFNILNIIDVDNRNGSIPQIQIKCNMNWLRDVHVLALMNFQFIHTKNGCKYTVPVFILQQNTALLFYKIGLETIRQLEQCIRLQSNTRKCNASWDS